MKDPLYKIEQTFYAVGISILGLYTAGVIVKDWFTGAIDRALTYCEPWSE